MSDDADGSKAETEAEHVEGRREALADEVEARRLELASRAIEDTQHILEAALRPVLNFIESWKIEQVRKARADSWKKAGVVLIVALQAVFLGVFATNDKNDEQVLCLRGNETRETIADAIVLGIDAALETIALGFDVPLEESTRLRERVLRDQELSANIIELRLDRDC